MTLRSSWAAVGRHLYSAVPVSTSSCGEGVISGVVDVNGTGAGEELATDATQDKRLERLALVDEIYLLLAGDCAAAADRLAVGSPLALMPSGNEDLVEIVTLVADKCELGL